MSNLVEPPQAPSSDFIIRRTNEGFVQRPYDWKGWIIYIWDWITRKNDVLRLKDANAERGPEIVAARVNDFVRKDIQDFPIDLHLVNRLKVLKGHLDHASGDAFKTPSQTVQTKIVQLSREVLKVKEGDPVTAASDNAKNSLIVMATSYFNKVKGISFINGWEKNLEKEVKNIIEVATPLIMAYPGQEEAIKKIYKEVLWDEFKKSAQTFEEGINLQRACHYLWERLCDSKTDGYTFLEEIKGLILSEIDTKMDNHLEKIFSDKSLAVIKEAFSKTSLPSKEEFRLMIRNQSDTPAKKAFLEKFPDRARAIKSTFFNNLGSTILFPMTDEAKILATDDFHEIKDRVDRLRDFMEVFFTEQFDLNTPTPLGMQVDELKRKILDILKAKLPEVLTRKLAEEVSEDAGSDATIKATKGLKEYPQYIEKYEKDISFEDALCNIASKKAKAQPLAKELPNVDVKDEKLCSDLWRAGIKFPLHSDKENYVGGEKLLSLFELLRVEAPKIEELRGKIGSEAEFTDWFSKNADDRLRRLLKPWFQGFLAPFTNRINALIPAFMRNVEATWDAQNKTYIIHDQAPISMEFGCKEVLSGPQFSDPATAPSVDVSVKATMKDDGSIESIDVKVTPNNFPDELKKLEETIVASIQSSWKP